MILDLIRYRQVRAAERALVDALRSQAKYPGAYADFAVQNRLSDVIRAKRAFSGTLADQPESSPTQSAPVAAQ